MKILCWIFGHRWTYFRIIPIPSEESFIRRQCSRCGHTDRSADYATSYNLSDVEYYSTQLEFIKETP
jgi:hypothetical protein